MTDKIKPIQPPIAIQEYERLGWIDKYVDASGRRVTVEEIIEALNARMGDRLHAEELVRCLSRIWSRIQSQYDHPDCCDQCADILNAVCDDAEEMVRRSEIGETKYPTMATTNDEMTD